VSFGDALLHVVQKEATVPGCHDAEWRTDMCHCRCIRAALLLMAFRRAVSYGSDQHAQLQRQDRQSVSSSFAAMSRWWRDVDRIYSTRDKL